jgi:hypothetical protein
MKTAFILFTALSGLTLSSTEVRLRIVDETQTPLPDAQVLIAFTTPVHGAEKRAEGLSDSRGFFSGSGKAIGSVFVRASKEGYYPARIERLPNDRDLDETVVLPKIIQPIPLLARLVGVGKRDVSGQSQELPPSGESFGFDFAVGEMLPPYGNGKVTDIVFKIRNEFKGWQFSDAEMARIKQIPVNRNITEQELKTYYGRYDGEVEITFPREKDGLVEEQTHFLPYSRLKLPHLAPAGGYVPTWRYEGNTYSPPTTRADVGFFLRTRVELDQDGKVISANYTKVMGDFSFRGTGGVSFTYYFNPTPNDRNLEFDPKKNLFPANTPGANVNDP